MVGGEGRGRFVELLELLEFVEFVEFVGFVFAQEVADEARD